MTKLKVIGVTILIALLVQAIAFYYMISSGPKVVSRDINDYGDFGSFLGYSDLLVFPEEIPESAEIIQYLYYQHDQLFDSSNQIYLEYKLSEEEYKKEVEILSRITKRFEHQNYEEVENKVVYDTDNFEYPAYVTAFNDNHVYEYALVIEEERKIVCIFRQFISNSNNELSKEYQPMNKKLDSFSIYYTPVVPGGARYSERNVHVKNPNK